MRNCPTYRRDIVRTMSTINKYEEMNVVVISAYLCVPLRLCGKSAVHRKGAEERRDTQRTYPGMRTKRCRYLLSY